MVLQDLFTQYPPDDSNQGEDLAGIDAVKADKMRENRDDIFCKPSLGRDEIGKKLESLASRIDNNPELQQVQLITIIIFTPLCYFIGYIYMVGRIRS